MGILNKMVDSIRLNEGGEEYIEKIPREPEEGRGGIVSMLFKGQEPQEEEMPEVVMLRPSVFEDAREICDYLLAGRSVIVSLERMTQEVASRVIDFSSGAVYCIDGTMEKVSDCIFIAVPREVDLKGSFEA